MIKGGAEIPTPNVFSNFIKRLLVSGRGSHTLDDKERCAISWNTLKATKHIPFFVYPQFYLFTSHLFYSCCKHILLMIKGGVGDPCITSVGGEKQKHPKMELGQKLPV